MPDTTQPMKKSAATDDLFHFADDLGPAKIIHITQPSLGLRAILVVDNVACGPSIGGARMAPDVSVDECFRLARAMTFKNAAAGLPHGGGKSVIFADPAMPLAKKEVVIRAFARATGEISDYIIGPDMGTDERCMAWAKDEIGRAVGLPREIGGIPLDEIGATGYGVAVAGEVAQDFAGITLDGARVAVQGFGAVGRHAARFLAAKGAVLVGASDSRGTISDPDGLDCDALLAIKQTGGSVLDHPAGTKGDRDAIVDIACDIWIPAARPDVVRADNVDRLNTKLILQGANIPITVEAEASLHARGVLSVPDFIANAGGVICAAVEYAGGTETAALATIDEKVRRNTEEVLIAARDSGTQPRDAALAMARARVERAMTYRRDS
jgi:glutamate dehydrogenase (NAD(P)+)